MDRECEKQETYIVNIKWTDDKHTDKEGGEVKVYKEVYSAEEEWRQIDGRWRVCVQYQN